MIYASLEDITINISTLLFKSRYISAIIVIFANEYRLKLKIAPYELNKLIWSVIVMRSYCYIVFQELPDSLQLIYPFAAFLLFFQYPV